MNCDNPISKYSDQTLIGHLNIRKLNGHIKDRQKDICLQYLSVLCLTETHTNQPATLTGFKVLSTPTEHGLAVYVRDTITCEKLRLTARTTDIQVMGICVKELNLPVIVVYRPPRQIAVGFFNDLSFIVEDLLEKFPHIIIIGDFNMPVHTSVMMEISTAHGLIQTVQEPTHVLGGILDLTFTNLQDIMTVAVPVPYTDHHLVCSSIGHS